MCTFPRPLSVVLLALLVGTLPGCISYYGLEDAARRGDIERVRTLLDHGDRAGIEPALLYSACEGQTEVAQLLLEKGASLSHIPPGWKFNALQCAAYDGRPEMVSLLLCYGADREDKGDAGKTALELAKQKGQASAVKLLEDAQGAPTTTPPKPPAPASAPARQAEPPPPIY